VDTAVLGVQRAPNPSRVSQARNTGTPSGSGTYKVIAGKLDARKA